MQVCGYQFSLTERKDITSALALEQDADSVETSRFSLYYITSGNFLCRVRANL